MKKYTVKNYKGNLVESLEKFSKKYKGMRITEAKVKDGELKVTAEAEESMPVIAINFYGTNKNKEQVLKGALWIKESDIEGEPNADKSTDYKDEIIDKVKKFIEDCGYDYSGSTYEQVTLTPRQARKFKEVYRAKIEEAEKENINEDREEDFNNTMYWKPFKWVELGDIATITYLGDENCVVIKKTDVKGVGGKGKIRDQNPNEEVSDDEPVIVCQSFTDGKIYNYIYNQGISVPNTRANIKNITAI